METLTPSTAAGASSDADLLREYRASRSQSVFAAIVRRHIGLVYQSALRQTRDPHLADDVTQAVFITFLQKAADLPAGAVLAGWLFTTTRYCASAAMRTQRRRQLHERAAAAEQQPATPAADSSWSELLPYLDTALARLQPVERDAILLKYIQERPIQEVCAALNLSEEAARKRLQRGVAKLRGYFTSKKLTLAAGAVEAMLVAQSKLVAPSGVQASAISASAAATSGAAPQAAAAIARSAQRLVWWNTKSVVAVSCVVIGAVVAIYWSLPDRSTQTIVQPVAADASKPAAILARDADLKDYPIAPGWPLALPGSITASPTVADVEGNGRLAILVACESYPNIALRHPNAHPAAWLYAFHFDGTLLAGWPVELVTRTARTRKEQSGGYTASWSSSPSVCKDRLGKTRIVLTTPYFLGFRVMTPEGRARDYHGGSQWANVPLIDIDGDGTPDIVTGAGILNIDGGKVAGFGPTHPIAHLSGYAPCIGDADGDGHPEIYHMFADTLDNLHGAGDQSTSQRADVMAYDRFGKPVLGWPQQVTKDDSMVSYAPVMGDVAGDGKKEIVARDLDSIHVWSCDGKPQTGAAGVIVSGLGAPSASPTLADLDGDGKAEIVIFDSQTSSIRAWHGDGTPVAGSDGTIAILPSDCGGVSVADLGGDGVMDLFAGSYWVKWDPKTRGSTVINMVPGPVEDDSGQPTICDLEGNGQAEAIFGLRDGRIVVYQTHLACKPQWLQWPTANGNPQHTGVWQSAPR